MLLMLQMVVAIVAVARAMLCELQLLLRVCGGGALGLGSIVTGRRPIAAGMHSEHGLELVFAHVRHLRNAVRAAAADTAQSMSKVRLLQLLMVLRLVLRIVLVRCMALVR